MLSRINTRKPPSLLSVTWYRIHTHPQKSGIKILSGGEPIDPKDFLREGVKKQEQQANPKTIHPLVQF